MIISKQLSKHQKGFSLIELGIVLGLIALTIVGVTILYNSLTGNVKNESMIKQITMISQGINKIYRASGGNYAGLTTQTVIDSGLVMSDLLHGGNAIGTSWYGSDHNSLITVAPADGTKFNITLARIPKDSCTAIGSNYLHGNSLAVTANGTLVNSSDALATRCANNNPATLVITFY